MTEVIVSSLEDLCIRQLILGMFEEHREEFWQMIAMYETNYIWPSTKDILDFSKCPLAYRLGQELGGSPWALTILEQMFVIGCKTHRSFHYQIRLWFMMGVYRAGHIDTIQAYTFSPEAEIEQRQKVEKQRSPNWPVSDRKIFRLSCRFDPAFLGEWVEEAARYSHLDILELFTDVIPQQYPNWHKMFQEAFIRADFPVCSWIQLHIPKEAYVWCDAINSMLEHGYTDAFLRFAAVYPDIHYPNITICVTFDIARIQKLSLEERTKAITIRTPVLELIWKYINREFLREDLWIKREWLNKENWNKREYDFKVSVTEMKLPKQDLAHMLV